MPYTYQTKQRVFAQLLEIGAVALLWPLLLISKKRHKKISKILLVEPFQMGDVLSLTPMIDPLLNQFPDAEIFILTKPSSGVVLECDKRIKQVFKIDFPWSDYGYKKNSLKRVIGMLSATIRLRGYNFDLGLDTRGDIRSQILLVLAGCRKRLGYQNYLHSNLSVRGWLLTDRLNRSKHPHRYHWNLELLTLLGINNSSIDFPSFRPMVDEVEILPPNYFVIHIGGGWEFKRWSEARWVQLITRLAEKGNGDIFVVGGPGEKEIVSRIEQEVNPKLICTNVRFEITTLARLIRLLQNCDRFIGLDSGPMNLAVCLNKPVIALFGPGDSTMWRPLNMGSTFVHKKENFPCNPCLQTICVFPKKNCMEQIEFSNIASLVLEGQLFDIHDKTITS